MTWDLKIRCFGEIALWGVFFGAGAGSAIFYTAKEQLGFPEPSAFWAGFWLLLGAATGIAVMSWWLKGRIKKSRERLANGEYAATLLRLGVASGAIHRLTAGPANSAAAYDLPVSEVARDYATSLQDLYQKHRNRLPKWSIRTWAVVSIGLLAAAYASAFALQSMRAEEHCLHDLRATSFYVSPWTLSAYCTADLGGRGYTFEASDR